MSLKEKYKQEAYLFLENQEAMTDEQRLITKEVVDRYYTKGKTFSEISLYAGFVMGFIIAKSQGVEMTNEEMDHRWPDCPPYMLNNIEFWSLRKPFESTVSRRFTYGEVTQDNIDDAIRYLYAAKGAMNG